MHSLSLLVGPCGQHTGSRGSGVATNVEARLEKDARLSQVAASCDCALYTPPRWSAPHKPFEAQSDDEVQAAVAARGAAWYSQCGWLAEMYGAGHGLSCDQDALEANADAAKGRFLARKHYEAMIVGLDRAFARANASLAAAGLWDRTLQIFISDNGGRLSEAQILTLPDPEPSPGLVTLALTP